MHIGQMHEHSWCKLHLRVVLCKCITCTQTELGFTLGMHCWVVKHNPTNTIQDYIKEPFSGIVSNILFNYNIGSPIVKSAKEKIEELDEAKKKVAYSVIGGDMTQYYKTFRATLEVIPEGEGSLVKWLCEFEKASEEVPDPSMIRDFAAKNFLEIDAYLLKA